MIALGMADNPQKTFECCLAHSINLTYIRFRENEPITERLIKLGILQRSQIALGGKSSFQDIFKEIHENEAYSNIIKYIMILCQIAEKVF